MPRSTQFPLSLPTSPYLPNPIEIDLQAFLEFQFWLAEELEQLVATRRPPHAPVEKVRGNKRPALNPAAAHRR